MSENGSTAHAYAPRVFLMALIAALELSGDPEADTFFPDLDELPNWELVEARPEMAYKGLVYSFTVYKNNDVMSK